MARLGRKKLFIPFDTSPGILDAIQKIKEKVRVKMVLKMHRSDSLEIDIRGSKEDVRIAMEKIKEILREEQIS
ncbi:hypothetical protein GF325_13565 [Candidatus Bathyarchaeota archaeon]|nr:hypothetical protein [Candidatus Bathyarchaeota archaeon]